MLIAILCPLMSFMLAKIVPEFAWLNQSAFKPVEQLSNAPLVAVVVALGVPALALVTAAIWWWRSGRLNGGRMRSGLLATLTGSFRVQRWTQASQFAEILLLLVQRGLPLGQSLRLAGQAANDPRLQTAAVSMAERIERGDPPRPATTGQDSLQRSGLPVLISLAMQHTKDRNLLAASLQQAASMYRERAIRAAEWYAEYLPILLTIVIGGSFTVGFCLFIFWPYVSMLHELSGHNWK
jgi:type II secretory pathway component PulF